MNKMFCQVFYFCLATLTGLYALGVTDNKIGWRNVVLSLGFSAIAIIYGVI